MKKYSILLVLIMYICCLSSCNNEETYADQLSREKAAIEKYIKDHKSRLLVKDNSLLMIPQPMCQKTNMCF